MHCKRARANALYRRRPANRDLGYKETPNSGPLISSFAGPPPSFNSFAVFFSASNRELLVLDLGAG